MFREGVSCRVEGGCLFVDWEPGLFVSITNAMPGDRWLSSYSRQESEKSMLSVSREKAKYDLKGQLLQTVMSCADLSIY